MKIREYNKKDYLKVKELICTVLKEIFNSDPRGLQDLDKIEKNFSLFLIAEEEGEIIGTLGIKDEGDARISRMYVKKEKRGKGVGKKLIKKALGFCKKRKFNRLFLTTYKKMGSKKFYEKQGFETYKENERIWMEKFL